MNGATAGGLGRAPRDRGVERPVELEDPGAVPIAPETAAVSVGQSVAGDPEELAGSYVEEDRVEVASELVKRVDALPRLDRAPERP